MASLTQSLPGGDDIPTITVDPPPEESSSASVTAQVEPELIPPSQPLITELQPSPDFAEGTDAQASAEPSPSVAPPEESPVEVSPESKVEGKKKKSPRPVRKSMKRTRSSSLSTLQTRSTLFKAGIEDPRRASSVSLFARLTRAFEGRDRKRARAENETYRISRDKDRPGVADRRKRRAKNLSTESKTSLISPSLASLFTPRAQGKVRPKKATTMKRSHKKSVEAKPSGGIKGTRVQDNSPRKRRKKARASNQTSIESVDVFKFLQEGPTTPQQTQILPVSSPLSPNESVNVFQFLQNDSKESLYDSDGWSSTSSSVSQDTSFIAERKGLDESVPADAFSSSPGWPGVSEDTHWALQESIHSDSGISVRSSSPESARKLPVKYQKPSVEDACPAQEELEYGTGNDYSEVGGAPLKEHHQRYLIEYDRRDPQRYDYEPDTLKHPQRKFGESNDKHFHEYYEQHNYEKERKDNHEITNNQHAIPAIGPEKHRSGSGTPKPSFEAPQKPAFEAPPRSRPESHYEDASGGPSSRSEYHLAGRDDVIVENAHGGLFRYRRFDFLTEQIVQTLEDDLSGLERDLIHLDGTISRLPVVPHVTYHDPGMQGHWDFYNRIHFQRTELLGRIFMKKEQYHKAVSWLQANPSGQSADGRANGTLVNNQPQRSDSTCSSDTYFTDRDDAASSAANVPRSDVAAQTAPGTAAMDPSKSTAAPVALAMLCQPLGFLLTFIAFSTVPSYFGRLLWVAIIAAGCVSVLHRAPLNLHLAPLERTLFVAFYLSGIAIIAYSLRDR